MPAPIKEVFIVDDSQDTAQMLAFLVQSCGFKARCFTDFQTAENEILPDHPCLLCTDYHMLSDDNSPETFINRVKAKFPGLKIVILSGDARKRSVAAQLGVDFLLKPPDIKDLEKLCASHCPEAVSK